MPGRIRAFFGIFMRIRKRESVEERAAGSRGAVRGRTARGRVGGPSLDPREPSAGLPQPQASNRCHWASRAASMAATSSSESALNRRWRRR